MRIEQAVDAAIHRIAKLEGKLEWEWEGEGEEEGVRVIREI